MKDISWLYCYKKRNKWVFLNKKDKVIKEFNTYKDCIDFAKNNIDLINY